MYVNNSGSYLLDVEENDEIPDIIREEVEKAFKSKIIIEFDIELKDRIYSFSITPFVEKNYVNLYGMDITESKLAEQKLKEINKLKSEFLRRASHELKTPLISIKGYSDLILALHKDQISSEIISKLNEINRGCERLQNIINNLLKTSQLESPELKPNVQKEDLSFLIKFCVHELQSLIQARNQTLDLNIQDGQYCIFEKEEIHDVVSNLLTNAIKYTPPYGKISINTEEKGDFILISVKDNGIGFTEEQESRIFKQFGKIERYGQGLDLGIDGTGLGLYISKRIVESHRGEIWMESEGKNKGSTFYFTIPSVK
jgi:signal transduction histidine kinase